MKLMLVCLVPGLLLLRQDFKTQQLAHNRVQTAFEEKARQADKLLAAKNIKRSELRLYLRAFKQEQVLEVWAKSKSAARYSLVQQYPFCTTSGTLGPKRRKGDGQIPEGFYYIDRYNPNSAFYLSLGLNYPNHADRSRCGTGNPGGDIFIHGSCVTIGCIPIQDEGIKELYVLAVEARNNGQEQIPVHIFPARLHDAGMATLRQAYSHEPELLSFWSSMAPAYTRFAATCTLPDIAINGSGGYSCK